MKIESRRENLNSSTINMLLNFLKANYIMIDIFAYLKLHMETMSFHTVPTEPETAVNAKDILLIFAEVVMNTTGTEEFAMQKGIKPFCNLGLFRKFTAYLQKYKTNPSTSKIKNPSRNRQQY